MPYEFKTRVLPNGLTVIAEVDPSAHTASAGFFVKTGARDEDPSVMGVSHFLEHMMFKGYGDVRAEALNRAFDEAGARNNAYTSSEMTCFYAHALPERLGTITGLLARMMRPALREDDFTTEKGVILEEIAMYKDNPFWVLYEEAVERHYRGQPMGHRVLGTSETIGALSRDSMASYFERRYSAGNTVAAFAGNLDFERVVDDVSSLCGAWSSASPGRAGPAPRAVGERFDLRDARVNRSYLFSLAPAPAMGDDRRYAAMLLAQVLGAPDNSRLHWSLIETGTAEEAQASYDAHDGVGEYSVFAACDPGREDEVWSTVEREMSGLAGSVTEEDLERFRNRIATAATLAAERPGDRMQRIGRQWTYLGRYHSLEDELSRINAVTLDDVRGVAVAFPIAPTTFGRLMPERAGAVG
ncbi:MAG: insulinase family protein [Phycisphaeraceae bacterium]|nr:MAG: insulinase family protein [Phycisphaeraceae bacterium]